ncbi:MAG: alpha-L-arabinofuranosidase C-terminal domain-containing protein [Thermoguttaceae bacterium]
MQSYPVGASAAESLIKISAKPLHEGRVSDKLFGNFIELLDDVVPSMWAEMLNDREFQGMIPSSEWCYYQGEPNVYLDRKWENNNTWSLDTTNTYCGTHSAKLDIHNPNLPGGAKLKQSGLYVKKDEKYNFSCWVRTSKDTPASITVTLKTELPNGDWTTLAKNSLLVQPDENWQKVEINDIISNGTTDRAVFEISAIGKWGSIWLDKLSLMPADNLHGWRKDVVELVKPIKPAIIRWGGSVCDPGGYKWKEGVGPRDNRVPFVNRVWGRIDSNDVGIDEFVTFCKLVGAEPLICVSFADGPESAADLVHYCNDPANTEWGKKRAENGYLEPHNIQYFQLGNELGGDVYAERCVEFCKSMKEADPNILLAASYANQRLLEMIGSEIAFICPHHYSPSFVDHERDFRNLINMINSTPGCDHLRLGITEWSFTAGDWGNGRARLQSLYSGIYSAQYFNLMLRYSNYVALACRSNLSNSFEGGTIMTKPGSVMKTPFYHTVKLYADNFQPIPITVESTPAGVDTMACLSENGNTMTVFLVNTNNHAVDFRFDLADWCKEPKFVKAEMVVDTQNRGQLEIMNHWSAPDRISTVTCDKLPTELPRYSTTAIVLEK